MKAKSILLSILIVIAILLDTEASARKTGGGGRSYSGGGRSYSGGGYSGGGRSTTTTTTYIRRNGVSMSPYYVNYATYRPVGFVIGHPYTDPTYGWYYNGTTTYRVA